MVRSIAVQRVHRSAQLQPSSLPIPSNSFLPSSRTSGGSIPTPSSGPTVCRRSLFSREHVSGRFPCRLSVVRHRPLRFTCAPCHSTAAVLYYYLYKRTAEYMGDPRLYEDSLWLREAFARARQWGGQRSRKQSQTVAGVDCRHWMVSNDRCFGQRLVIFLSDQLETCKFQHGGGCHEPRGGVQVQRLIRQPTLDFVLHLAFWAVAPTLPKFSLSNETFSKSKFLANLVF